MKLELIYLQVVVILNAVYHLLVIFKHNALKSE